MTAPLDRFPTGAITSDDTLCDVGSLIKRRNR